MRWIGKNRSPEAFEKWKHERKPNNWGDLPGSLPTYPDDEIDYYYSKTQLREALLREQYSKCLYCERMIINSELKTRIDHVKIPRSKSNRARETLFDYDNLGLSCEAADDGDARRTNAFLRQELHCDAHMSDSVLPFTPYDSCCEEKLEFHQTGRVSAVDEDGEEVIRILNLDCQILRNRREGAISSFIRERDSTDFVSEDEAKKLYEQLLVDKGLEYSKAILDSLQRLFR